MTEPRLPKFERTRIRREQDLAKRQAALDAIDFTSGVRRDLTAAELKPGMVLDHVVFSYFLDDEETVTDVVVSIEPRENSVSITWADGYTDSRPLDHMFPDVWTPAGQ